MVSKVAVVALVAIFAVPILMGYGMNLSEVTRTEYAPDNDPVNVTELLQTGTAYTTANAEITSLNTNFEYNGNPYVPVYTTTSNTMSSVQWVETPVTLAPNTAKYWRLNETDNEIFVYIGGHNSGVTLIRLDYTGNNIISTTNNMETLYYSAESSIVERTYSGGSNYYTVTDTREMINFWNTTASEITIYFYNRSSTGTSYVNLADGFTFQNQYNSVQLNTPDKTKSIMMTVDLNTISDSSYHLGILAGIARVQLNKSTNNGVATWSVIKGFAGDNPETVIDSLYYDPNKSSNTYQFTITQELIGTYETEPIPILNIPSYTYYIIKISLDFKYVGNWPTLIGSANYYQRYEYSWTRDLQNSYDTFDRVNFYSTGSSPKLRVDGALYSAFAYRIISDTTYTPADFRDNPTTTLSVNSAGTSLEFGGNTYTVDAAGNITLGTHKVSTNGLKLESLPVAVGYENKINGNVISVTAQPSTIKFNGFWGASVSTVGNETTTVTKTDWTPGEFAWDGIDQNFLMVGLLAAIGVFIALGIAYRKTKAALGALLVVCGGAILLFFTML